MVIFAELTERRMIEIERAKNLALFKSLDLKRRIKYLEDKAGKGIK